MGLQLLLWLLSPRAVNPSLRAPWGRAGRSSVSPVYTSVFIVIGGTVASGS